VVVVGARVVVVGARVVVVEFPDGGARVVVVEFPPLFALNRIACSVCLLKTQKSVNNVTRMRKITKCTRTVVDLFILY